jgi:nitrogenase-associated protein
MAKIVFEKPGCANNTRQKALLAAAGHEVDARNLLTEKWTAQRLRPFFGARPVAEWFNRAAPRVKSGEVVPEQLDEASAIALMLAEPLLIRRPLIQAGKRREAGFDQELVDAWIGLGPSVATPPAKGWETCTKGAHARACATKD